VVIDSSQLILCAVKCKSVFVISYLRRFKLRYVDREYVFQRLLFIPILQLTLYNSILEILLVKNKYGNCYELITTVKEIFVVMYALYSSLWVM
jgi:hypothetical protein